jgi:hypothetical protein
MDWLKTRLSSGGSPVASHPAGVTAKPWRVVSCYPLWPVLLAIFWFVSLIAVLDGFHWSAFLLLALATYGNYAYWSSIRPWFAGGDVCPAVVVNESPMLVASLADLTAGDGSFPAVKIRREPAKLFPGDSGKFGRRTVTIVRYDGTPSAHVRCWTNFHPRPLQSATDDLGELQRLLHEIKPQQWMQLQEGVKRLPRPFKPGLYRLTDDV